MHAGLSRHTGVFLDMDGTDALIPHPSAQSESEHRREYLEYRRFLMSTEADAANQFDKYVLTLSSAALAFSINFLKDVVGQHPTNLLFLIGSWMAFGASCAVTLLSFQMSQKVYHRTVEILDAQFENPSACPLENEYLGRTSRLNNLSLLCFALGIVLTIAFMGSNIGVSHE